MNNIEEIMKTLSKAYPSTKTTLNNMRQKPNAFKILISCLLSLRTQDKNTEKASNALFTVAQTPEQILNLETEKLEQLIFSSGHYKKKAQTLKHVSEEILNRFNNQVPADKEQLLSIKGIGPKTANIVLCFAYNQTVIPVDVNVHRVSNRLGWVNTKVPEKTEKELETLLPRKYWKELNNLFMQHGKTFCVPISPKCSICPIKSYCPKVGVERSR